MAIQLNTQTAPQQKAPFSAFDTTSNYRSGLSDVAQGLSQVGQAAFKIATEQKRQKEQAQKLLSGEAYTNYNVELDRAHNELDHAFKTGNIDQINQAKANFSKLQEPDFNKFLGEDAGGLIESESALAPYRQKAGESWGMLNNKVLLQENNRLVSNRTNRHLDGLRSTTIRAITNNPSGLPSADAVALFNSLIPSDEFHNLLDAQLTGDMRNAFGRNAASSAVALLKHQLKTANSADELNARKEIGDAFVNESLSSYGFTEEHLLNLEDIYNTRYAEVSDPTYLVEQAEEEFTTLNNTYDAFWNLTSATDSRSAAQKLEQQVINAKENPYVVKEHGDALREMEEVLSMFTPPVDAQGNLLGDRDSLVDLLARRFILSRPDSRPSFADFQVIVDKDSTLSNKTVERVQNYINSRIDIVERGLAESDLASLGALYPDFKNAITSGDQDKARLYYTEVILPELTAEGMDAGVYGEVGGNIKLPPEMWFGLTDEVVSGRFKQRHSVEQAASDVYNLLVKNRGHEEAAIAGAMFAAGSPSISEGKHQTYMLFMAAARAVREGDDPQTVTEQLLEFDRLAVTNVDNDQVNDLYDEFYAKEDVGAVMDVELLDSVQRIKQLDGTTRYREKVFYENQLKGLIAKYVKQGHSTDEVFELVQQHEDRYLRPYYGTLRQVREGQTAFIHPEVYNENVDPKYERRGLLGSMFISPISEVPALGGKTGAKRVAEISQAAVIAWATKHYNILDTDIVRGDMDFGFRDLKAEIEKTTLPVGEVGFTPELYRSQMEAEGVEEMDQRALFLGLSNNNYYPAGEGLFGPKGDGVPIAEVRGTTFRQGREYYVLEAYNPRLLRYESIVDSDNKEVLVPVDVINPIIRKAVLEDVGLNPLDVTIGDFTTSATSSQNRVWNLLSQ
jgi:hypothetical protein